MAKKAGTAVAVVEKAVPALLVKNDVPSYLQAYKGRTGTEDLTSDDITLPRIKLGQSMSKEVKAGDLEEGALFLNLTGETLAAPGQGLRIVPLWRGKEYILWRPRKDNGGGILARARPVPTPNGTRYKWDKPNTSFEVKVEGVVKVVWTTKEYIDEDGLDQWASEVPGDPESKKAATEHFNYVVALPDHGNMLAGFSLENTRARRAKDFNAVLKMRQDIPIWARIFSIVSEDDNRGADKFKNVVVKPAGFVAENEFPGYDKLALAFVGKTINIDQSDGDRDDDGDEDGKL